MNPSIPVAFTRLLCLFAVAFFAAALRAHAGPTHELIAGFEALPSAPAAGELVAGGDGYYWGVTTNGGAFGRGSIFKVRPDGSDWRIVASFSDNGTINKGREPSGGLTSDGAGFLWGVTRIGGTANFGTVFKVNVATGVVTTMVNFANNSATVAGSNPVCTLAFHNGFLWGTTQTSGVNFGSFFRINATTGAFSTLFEFTGTGGANKGSGPSGVLTSDGAGNLWGTTVAGGASDQGTLYRVNVSNNVLTTISEFSGANGTRPESGVFFDGAGFLWGTTPSGGPSSRGTVYKISATALPGTVVTTVVDFVNDGVTNPGRIPAGRVVADGAGRLWGTTAAGPGSGGNGTIFSLPATAGAGATITNEINFGFSNAPRGGAPRVGLTVAPGGLLLGTTPGGGVGQGTVFSYHPATTTFTTLLQFDVNTIPLRGQTPRGALFGDTADTLWFTTGNGGQLRVGTVGKVTPSENTAATAIEFQASAGTLGSLPEGGLTPDGAGFYWGTTSASGAGGASGTIFKINASTGALTTVVNFNSTLGTGFGRVPQGALLKEGNFMWGVTESGGSAGNFGTIFKVDITSGALTRVASFTGNGATNKGSAPRGRLVRDDAGFIWGTTRTGGANGLGTVFKIEASAGADATVTTIAEFANAGLARGSNPVAGLVSDGAGNLWGSTSSGGNNSAGTIFKIPVNAAAGSGVTTVVDFTGTGGANRGAEPLAAMTGDGAGLLWGTTFSGGTGNFGTVYSLDPLSGTLTTRFDFTGTLTASVTGSSPQLGALFRHSDGNFYGTTTAGGPAGGGTIYRIRFGATPVTGSAAAVSFTSATLHGTINPNGATTTAAFEIGTHPQLVGATTIAAGTTSAGAAAEAVSASATGLSAGTTYYFRAVGTNAENAVPQRGAIRSFTTLANQAPTVVLLGANPLTVEAGAAFSDPGATANDPEQGALTPTILSSTVNTSLPGSYAVAWRATDAQGAQGTATRVVNVVDTTPPVVTPPANVSVNATTPTGAFVNYSAASASDFVGVTSLSYSHPVGVFPNGTTTVTVTATDAANNTGTATFTVTVTPLAPVSSWRFTNFGSAANSGTAADDADPDRDGLRNLVEFAVGTDPNAPSVMQATISRHPGSAIFTYRRAKSAVTAGAQFIVEWAGTPVSATWSTAGVTQTVIAQDASTEQVQAVIDIGNATAGFVRLRVTQ